MVSVTRLVRHRRPLTARVTGYLSWIRRQHQLARVTTRRTAPVHTDHVRTHVAHVRLDTRLLPGNFLRRHLAHIRSGVLISRELLPRSKHGLRILILLKRTALIVLLTNVLIKRKYASQATVWELIGG